MTFVKRLKHDLLLFAVAFAASVAKDEDSASEKVMVTLCISPDGTTATTSAENDAATEPQEFSRTETMAVARKILYEHDLLE